MTIIDDLTAAPAAGGYAALADGTVIDLRHQQMDATGIPWEWTGQRDTTGQPLMRSWRRDLRGHFLPTISTLTAVPLQDLHDWHGPLHQMPARPTFTRPIRPTPADVFGGIS
ncbi:phiSA1p31-related protein [Streptomyces natalensis]|uniref:Uncharacterized protein n=1 Tax=Streptomyces natalensis ATCC 27448 TaxID=1240678 RepID=A0A0D7CN98_9ACTN|nr:phiSA1p31-related protein [Streptomyces natalensis]KIZ16902.1 hypothetical protein SNA_18190 [Streptomyces natalensis ATCC 27448]